MAVEVGSIVEGKITGVKKFGAFVALPGGQTGMVHISEVSNEYIQELSDVLSEGQTVKVKVMSISPRAISRFPSSALSRAPRAPSARIPAAPGSPALSRSRRVKCRLRT